MVPFNGGRYMKKQIRQFALPIKGLIRKNKAANRLVTDYNFRTVIFSAISFVGGIGFAIFNIAVAAITHSLWCGAMACYHILLVILRGYILFSYGRIYRFPIPKEKNEMLCEMKRYRFCGISFIALTFCLIALILFIVRGDKVFHYGMYAVYTVTGFTLFQISIAVANYVKAQKNDNYTVRALRCINLTSALVSFLSVQAISLDTFSTGVSVPFMNALTGFAICGLIVASGVYMIAHSTARIKAFRADRQADPIQIKKNYENITHHS